MNALKRLCNSLKRAMLVLWTLVPMWLIFVPAVDAEVTYYHNDLLGSPVVATDESGNVIWREEYKPFGERIIKDPAADFNKMWFTGKPHDVETGLTYMNARYYDPVVGRFMGIDPKGFEESNIHSFNRFSYASNNPYKFIDPNGEAVETIIDIVSLGISIEMFRREPSILNGLGVAYDGLATAIPFLPAGFGIIKNAAHGGDLLNSSRSVTKGAMARGRAAEQRVLNDLGLSKNTQKVRTGEGASIPDALTKRQSFEIKDCISVSCTRQIRIQTDAARASGRESVLITGSKTRVNRNATRAFDKIERRSDLGPQ